MERGNGMERWEPLGGGISVLVSGEHGFAQDALLLAAFARPRAGERVCDLGTGCGILPLLWCRDTACGHVDAVELAPQAASMAARSVERAALTQRVKIHCADMRRLQGLLPGGAYDRVACNPPYFAAGSGAVSQSSAARTARHEGDGAALDDVVAAAARLLRNGGRFCLCYRPERLCDLVQTLRGGGLEPKRLQTVQQRAGDAPWLLLCEARRQGRPGLVWEPPLILQAETAYNS